MVNRNKIEAAVLAGLREVLKDPGYWKHYLKVYNDERRLLASGAARDRANLERRAGEIKHETERLIDAITQGAPADVIAPKLKALEAERLSVEEQLAAANDKGKPVAIHPAAIKNYLDDIAAMRDSLDDQDTGEGPDLVAPLRRLIHSVVVHAQPGVKGAFDVEIKGRLQELLGAPFFKRAVGGGPLVAGEGLEPPTPGL